VKIPYFSKSNKPADMFTQALENVTMCRADNWASMLPRKQNKQCRPDLNPMTVT